MDRILPLIKEKADLYFQEAVDMRHHLHMYPELSEQEIETEKYICSKLNNLGIPYENHISGHGVSAIIYGKNKEHGIAIRADIDALPVEEDVDVPFKSVNKGVMHACGHDLHTAVLLGTAKVLNDLREYLPGSVRLLFQPQEETKGAADAMIKHGCLKNPEIKSVIGLHIDPSVDAGKVFFQKGSMNASTCEFRVKVKGLGCHGAHPNLGIDPLPIACTMVTSLQTIITRRLDPTDSALITVGQFHSGSKNNVIPDETVFSGTIRTLINGQRDFIKSEISRICTNIAAAHGAACEIIFDDGYPVLTNDDELLKKIAESSEEILGKENVIISDKQSLGADDFAYFCHEARGLYYNIGCHTPGKDRCSLHSASLCPDEECIRVGMLSEAYAVFRILQDESAEW